MAIILLDTSVASLLLPDRERRPDLALYLSHIVGNTPAVSFQSVAELRRLAERRRWGGRRCAVLDASLQHLVVIPYDYYLAQVWARVSVEAERGGRRLESEDAWIVATAVRHHLTLLSHDRDLVDLPVAGLNVVSFL
jgi:tRNA(fMet)-specific endonuclease VapC